MDYLFASRVVLLINLLIGVQKSYCMTAEAIKRKSYFDLVCDDLLGELRQYIKRSHRRFIKRRLPPRAYELSYHRDTVRMMCLAADGKSGLIRQDSVSGNIGIFWDFNQLGN